MRTAAAQDFTSAFSHSPLAHSVRYKAPQHFTSTTTTDGDDVVGLAGVVWKSFGITFGVAASQSSMCVDYYDSGTLLCVSGWVGVSASATGGPHLHRAMFGYFRKLAQYRNARDGCLSEHPHALLLYGCRMHEMIHQIVALFGCLLKLKIRFEMRLIWCRNGCICKHRIRAIIS